MLAEGLRVNSKETITLARLALTGKKCLQTIISQQNQDTGLFPASAQDRCLRSEDGGYSNHWFRDSSIAILLLNDPVVRSFIQIYLPSVKKKDIDNSTRRWVAGTVKLISQETWQAGFNQPILEERIWEEGIGKTFARVDNIKRVPPIRTDLAGKPIEDWAHHQPDSWGFWAQAVSAAISSGVIDRRQLDDSLKTEGLLNLKNALKVISKYLLRLKPHEIEAVSMWEEGLCRNPTPLSIIISCAGGLKALMSYQDTEDQAAILDALSKSEAAVRYNSPQEFTIDKGHLSKTDLATLVVVAKLPEEDLPAFDPLRMLTLMDEELRVGEEGMMRRYKGDKYFQVDGREAVWFMSLPLEATLSFKLAEYYRKNDLHIFSREWLKRGKKVLSAALGLYDKYGFAPELFLQKVDSEGKIAFELPPPGKVNNLLWSNIELITACAYAARAKAIA